MTRLKRKKDLQGKKSDVRFGTPKEVAAYRAERLCENIDTIIEIGAGAGFQTEEFAKHGKVIAIDINKERLKRAKFSKNVSVIAGDALDPEIVEEIQHKCGKNVVVFLDPERPPASKKRSLEEIQPNIKKFLEIYKKITMNIAIELPPFLKDIPFDCEKEYLSINGQLNRLTIYFGELKLCDISVVQLPDGERIEHNGNLPQQKDAEVQPTLILVPDKAVEHAGLTPPILPACKKIGTFYLAEKSAKFCRSYKIVAKGAVETITEHIGEYGSLILHGRLEEKKQRELLRTLNPHCLGTGRAHLFVDKIFYLTTRE